LGTATRSNPYSLQISDESDSRHAERARRNVQAATLVANIVAMLDAVHEFDGAN
jgi:hypothetical protein